MHQMMKIQFLYVTHKKMWKTTLKNRTVTRVYYTKVSTKRTGGTKIYSKNLKPVIQTIDWREDQITKKGSKFTPVPKPNYVELKSDSHEFSRKLRLIEFFRSENSENFATPET